MTNVTCIALTMVFVATFATLPFSQIAIANGSIRATVQTHTLAAYPPVLLDLIVSNVSFSNCLNMSDSVED
ncbi:hypothetical protein PF005_g32296, partial [Phytophthora fragariae]